MEGAILVHEDSSPLTLRRAWLAAEDFARLAWWPVRWVVALAGLVVAGAVVMVSWQYGVSTAVLSWGPLAAILMAWWFFPHFIAVSYYPFLRHRTGPTRIDEQGLEVWRGTKHQRFHPWSHFKRIGYGRSYLVLARRILRGGFVSLSFSDFEDAEEIRQVEALAVAAGLVTYARSSHHDISANTP
jgi:hypothetical protein